MSIWAKQRAVKFIPPIISIYQSELIRDWLFLIPSEAWPFASEPKKEFDKLIAKITACALGEINLVQANILLDEITDLAYLHRNARVLLWLHELAIETGRVLCSPLAAEIAADSALCHRLDNQHAKLRNRIETLIVRLHIRFAMRKLGYNDQMFTAAIECQEIIHHAPQPVVFKCREFYAATEVVAKQLVESTKGGTHEAD